MLRRTVIALVMAFFCAAAIMGILVYASWLGLTAMGMTSRIILCGVYSYLVTHSFDHENKTCEDFSKSAVMPLL